MIAAASLAVGCEDEAPPLPVPPMTQVELATATAERVTGTVASEAFEAVDVRYRVSTRARRERIDLLFSDRPIERCGLPIVRSERLVWLRVPGVTSLEPATFASDAEEHALSVHYEVLGEHDAPAVGRGSGRLELTGLDAERLSGRIAVCFADSAASCVRGRFLAHPCYSRIDGRAIRETPGLGDDALEPPGPGAPTRAEPRPRPEPEAEPEPEEAEPEPEGAEPEAEPRAEPRP